jgi:polysaccharide export outer membrane protein
MKTLKTISLFLLAAILLQLSPALLAQDSAPPTPKLYIGPGDLLVVSMFNAPEIYQTVRVDDLGDASLPLIGKVHLAGLTTTAGEALIAQTYQAKNFFLHPEVSVFISEYSTQGTSVLGEVLRPGVYPVLGTRSLLDIISAAGGTTPTASNDITVQRHADGSILTVKLSKNSRESLAADVEILPGDKIIVGRAGIVYVIGNVNRPGGFVMQNEGTISLLQAIAMAEGSTSTAALDHAKLIRKTPEGYVEILAPLQKILNGQAPDREMQAEDILYVPNSIGKTIFYRGLPSIAQSAVSAATYRTY